MSAVPQSMTDYVSGRRAELPCASGVNALRDLLRRYARDGAERAPEESWRVAARLMCEDARARAIQIEELLVGLKRTWPQLAEPERIPRGQSAHLLSRLVTLCVQEYYGPLD